MALKRLSKFAAVALTAAMIAEAGLIMNNALYCPKELRANGFSSS